MEVLRSAGGHPTARVLDAPVVDVFALIVPALLFGSMAALALTFYLGGTERIASGVNLPAQATSASTLATRISAILAVAAGLAALGKVRKGVPLGFGLTVAVLSGAVAFSELLLWSNVHWSDITPTFTGVAVLLTLPLALRVSTDKQILFGISPIIALSAASIFEHLARGSYLFPWYNRWGLVGALLSATAASLTGIGMPARGALLILATASVMLSTSRQALLALLLVLGLMLFRTGNIGARVRRFAFAAILGGIVYAAISASSRVEAVGGVAADNGRHALLASAWSVLSRSPVFGLAGAKPDASLASSLNAVGLGWSTSVHDFPLDAWLRGGIVAAVAAAFLVAKMVWPSAARGRLLGLALLPFFLLGSELLYLSDTSAAVLLALAYGIGLSGEPRPGSRGAA